MKHMLAVLIFLPIIAEAHSSDNPVDDIAKYDQTVTKRQSEFKQSQQTEDQRPRKQNSHPEKLDGQRLPSYQGKDEQIQIRLYGKR